VKDLVSTYIHQTKYEEPETTEQGTQRIFNPTSWVASQTDRQTNPTRPDPTRPDPTNQNPTNQNPTNQNSTNQNPTRPTRTQADTWKGRDDDVFLEAYRRGISYSHSTTTNNNTGGRQSNGGGREGVEADVFRQMNHLILPLSLSLPPPPPRSTSLSLSLPAQSSKA
jgi:hypothetical protein